MSVHVITGYKKKNGSQLETHKIIPLPFISAIKNVLHLRTRCIAQRISEFTAEPT